MYYALSLLAGTLISVMVVFNGHLNDMAGMGWSLIIIHVSGILAIGLAMLFRKDRPRPGGRPPWWYTGGLIGILTTLFNLYAFGRISVSAMLALALLGESLASLAADHVGFMGLPRRPMRAEKLLGGLIILAGILIMLTDFAELLAVILSLLAGVSVLWSRLVNARLARSVGIYSTTLINYLAGLLGALLVLVVSGVQPLPALGGPLTNYLGGALGALIVLISNYVVGRIASFYMTLIMFVGQVAASLLLDMMLMDEFPVRIALGGLLVLAGLTLSLLQDRARARREAAQTNCGGWQC